MTANAIRIGLISDTHGLLRPQALAALQGSDHIVHAGDIGAPGILDRLAEIAPVTAVRGNNDRDPHYGDLPETSVLRVGGIAIHVLHRLADFKPDATYRVVVSGHSHRASSLVRDGVLHVNPGSAGPRRFSLPVTVGWLTIDDGEVRAELIELDIQSSSCVRSVLTRPR